MSKACLLQMSGVVVDLMYQVETVPLAGEEAKVTGFSMAPGGGFNAMIAAKRSGIDVSYGGPIGTGPFADLVLQALNENEIPFLGARNSALDQGCCTVLIDNTGERTFITSDGAEGTAFSENLDHICAADYDWCLLSGYSLNYPRSQAPLTAWLKRFSGQERLLFDPSPVVAQLQPEVLGTALAAAHWVSANAKEAAILTGQSVPLEAARHLASALPADGGAIVRDGAAGCYLAQRDTPAIHIPGIPVQSVDTNGAGDAHVGSFISLMSEGNAPSDAAAYANAAAALSTTRRGPSTTPERSEVEALLHARLTA